MTNYTQLNIECSGLEDSGRRTVIIVKVSGLSPRVFPVRGYEVFTKHSSIHKPKYLHKPIIRYPAVDRIVQHSVVRMPRSMLPSW